MDKALENENKSLKKNLQHSQKRRLIDVLNVFLKPYTHKNEMRPAWMHEFS